MLTILVIIIITICVTVLLLGLVTWFYNSVDAKLKDKEPKQKSINKIRLQLNNGECGYRDNASSWVEFIKVNDDVMVLFCINGKQHFLPQKKLNEFFMRVFD